MLISAALTHCIHLLSVPSVLQRLFSGGFQLNVNVGVMGSDCQFDCKPFKFSSG